MCSLLESGHVFQSMKERDYFQMTFLQTHQLRAQGPSAQISKDKAVGGTGKNEIAFNDRPMKHIFFKSSKSLAAALEF